MRRQDKSTPPVPPVTPEEQEAQRFLTRCLELLWFLEYVLEQARAKLTYPENSEAMGTGEVPESLSFSLLGSIECALTDHIDPLDKLLREATTESPERLALVWQRRKDG